MAIEAFHVRSRQCVEEAVDLLAAQAARKGAHDRLPDRSACRP